MTPVHFNSGSAYQYAENAAPHNGNHRASVGNGNQEAGDGITTGADVGRQVSPGLHRRSGSTIRRQLHGPEHSPAEDDFGGLDGIGERLPPPFFEFDEQGRVKMDSMPEHIAILFRAAEETRLEPSAALGFLAARSSNSSFDVFQTASIGTAAAMNVIMEQLRASQIELMNMQIPLSQNGAANASATRVYMAAAVMKNLIVSGALLYSKWPTTMNGALRVASFLVVELASAWANGTAFLHVGQAQSAANEARQLRDSAIPDPRLNPRSGNSGETDPAASAILDQNKYALLETIQVKLAQMQTEIPELPNEASLLKSMFVQIATMALGQLLNR